MKSLKLEWAKYSIKSSHALCNKLWESGRQRGKLHWVLFFYDLTLAGGIVSRHQHLNWDILASITALSWCWAAMLHPSYPTSGSVFPSVFTDFTTRNPRSRCPASVWQVRSLTCARSNPRNPQPRSFPVLILSAAPCTNQALQSDCQHDYKMSSGTLSLSTFL